MKLSLPILFCFVTFFGSAQNTIPVALPVPQKDLKVVQNYTGQPLFVWREVFLKEPHWAQTICKALIENAKNNLVQTYHSPKDLSQLVTLTDSIQADKILIYEKWGYNNQQRRAFVDIIAIAPAYVTDKKYQALFWSKYADVSTIIEQLPVVVNKDTSSMLEVFEQRLFTSKIIKR